MTHTLTVRPMETTDHAEVLRLLSEVMGGGPTGGRRQDFWDWKHRDNPFGRSLAYVATDAERIIGVRMFLRWELGFAGTTARAVRAVDTVTHPTYQRQGVFRRLNTALLSDARADGVDLVFNTPNADSRPANLSMGWRQAAVLRIHVTPGRPFRFLIGAAGARKANASGAATAVATVPVDTGSSAVSRLPEASAILVDPSARRDLERLVPGRSVTPHECGPHTEITMDYLRWRYSVPGLDYRAVTVSDGGRLTGVGLGRMRRRAGLNELTLGNVVVAPGDGRSAARVLRAARRSGADHVTVHAPPRTELHSACLVSGYLKVPGRGITLLGTPLTSLGTAVLDSPSWRLSLGDLEVF